MAFSEITQQGALVAVGFMLAFLVFGTVFRRAIERRSARKLHESKEQFIGLASHYLLTPITIIQTAISRLQEADSSLTSEQRMALYESVALGQQRLWIIAEQMVLISQISSNSLKLQYSVGNFSEVVSNAVASVDIFARHKKIRMVLNDTTKEVREARFDARRVRQALIALLDNAIKFSMEGTTITVNLRAENGLFVLSVEDEGIGMPKEVLEQLGQPFYRGSGIYNFDYEGIGMGLNLALSIVRLHEGNLGYSSREGRGTVATAQFPIR